MSNNKIMAKATSTGKFKPSVLSDEEKQQLSDVQDKYKSDEYGWNDNVAGWDQNSFLYAPHISKIVIFLII